MLAEHFLEKFTEDGATSGKSVALRPSLCTEPWLKSAIPWFLG